MNIQHSKQRETIQAILPDGRIFEGKRGATVEDFFKAACLNEESHYVAAHVNGKLRELSTPLQGDATLAPITMALSDGVRIYRRSLSFLMIAAAAECFPNDIITVHHSMPFGGYYCERKCRQTPAEPTPLDSTELRQLEKRMRELVAADLPITQLRVPLPEALKLFRQNGDPDKADLFARRRKDYLTLYELNGVKDYFHGFMVPSTGYLNLFALRPYRQGFIVQFPRRQQPDALQPFEDEERLAQIFQDYARWLDVVGVPDVAALNRAIEAGKRLEIILVAEAFHSQQLSAIAGEIADQGSRVVLISGPTSAGKTTFSKRLAVQLLAMGIYPVAIAMDNYFVDRESTPRDESGDYDFERLEAVDIPLFRQHLKQLLAGETIQIPHFNFKLGKREAGDTFSINQNQVILVEGIHGLNPALVEGISSDKLYRVFLSAFTQLNLDQHNRVPTTDTRLLRRMVRDAKHRGYSATDTIRRWQSVRRGEKRYIFPNQNNADIFFNSALVYEVAALKRLAEPLLLQVEPGVPERVEAQRLLAFLQWFEPVDTVDIPSDSILREFVGGSILRNYEPWR